MTKSQPTEPPDAFAILLRLLAREREFIRTHQTIAQGMISHLTRLDLPRFKRTFVVDDATIPGHN